MITNLKHYYSLTKPGIIYGNAITAIAGFLLASKGSIDYWLLLLTLAGISLVMASGCVFNNYIDRDIDALMERTRNRVLVRGLISGQSAIVYATTLGLLGVIILYLYANLLTVSIAIAGLFVYVVVYSLWGKRYSVYGTLVGSISGAVPPVVGYCAVTNNFDMGALILFLALCLWQMPHSYAIAIYRLNDYVAAGIPVLPVKKGIRVAKIQTLFYIAAFLLVASLLTVLGYTGYVYLGTMILLGLAWVVLAIKGFRVTDDKLWARRMFLFSILILMVFCIMIAIDLAISKSLS